MWYILKRKHVISETPKDPEVHGKLWRMIEELFPWWKKPRQDLSVSVKTLHCQDGEHKSGLPQRCKPLSQKQENKMKVCQMSNPIQFWNNNIQRNETEVNLEMMGIKERAWRREGTAQDHTTSS